jgi:phospholipid/cholesterol/gamma-HCH transport system ATP-binding protein
MTAPQLEAKNLTVAYGDFIVQKNINFTVNKGDVFIIMGESGCGKSSLLKLLIGLKEPTAGKVLVKGVDFWKSKERVKSEIMQKNGVLYQSGALFSSMTVAENIALPLQQYTSYSEREIKELVSLKLSVVGLAGFEEFYPSELSGGMKKRAGLARALALDPEVLYFDEPSAGLDPVSARQIDDLIKEISQNLGTAIVVVTHELASIFSIGTNAVFLDSDTKTASAYGAPKELLKHPPNKNVLNFLTRGENKK